MSEPRVDKSLDADVTQAGDANESRSAYFGVRAAFAMDFALQGPCYGPTFCRPTFRRAMFRRTSQGSFPQPFEKIHTEADLK